MTESLLNKKGEWYKKKKSGEIMKTLREPLAFIINLHILMASVT